jgi:predicted MPP superfamily phosphohydrolase
MPSHTAILPRVLKRSLGLLALAGLVALPVWSFWLEPASLRNEDHALELPGWPVPCDGLKIALLTDLHVGSPFNGLPNLHRVVELTQAARPDLILLLGDYVIHGIPGGTFVPPEEIAPVLGELGAPLGVYAVLGNHDWWLDAPRVTRALEAAGIPVLEDASSPVERGTCRFWLAGIGDFWESPHDVGAALRDVPDGAPVIAFTHNPDVFPNIPARVTLTIAGHTHGGQVNLPLIGRLIVPSLYGQRFASGHIVEDGRQLFVATGVGTSIVPVRFRVPPEVSMLILHDAERAGPG